MNVLFLTISRITTIEQRGIYQDLIRKFRDEGHKVFIVSPMERRMGNPTTIFRSEGVITLAVKTLNVQKTSAIEKGLGQVSMEWLYKRAIKKHFNKIPFDLILYSTPPITLAGVVKYLKKTYPKATSYLMLKDIFPQNAIDLGMLSKYGWKGLLYRHFCKQEKSLYKLSDYIGCTSPANVEYLLSRNSFIDKNTVNICPNSIELSTEQRLSEEEKRALRTKNNLPNGIPILIYGGNLGEPQGIPFLIECLEANKKRTDCHFLIIGTGTYLPMLQKWFESNKGTNVTVMQGLPKAEYDQLVQVCHIGLIFLDFRFSFPNTPSRILSYLENKMPVISCTDTICDLGYLAEENGFGFYAPSNNVKAFTYALDKILSSDLKVMGENGYKFLCKNYLVQNAYDAIMERF